MQKKDILKHFSYQEIKENFPELFYTGLEKFLCCNSLVFSKEDLMKVLSIANLIPDRFELQNIFPRTENQFYGRKFFALKETNSYEFLEARFPFSKEKVKATSSISKNIERSQNKPLTLSEEFKIVSNLSSKFPEDLFANLRPINSLEKRFQALQIYENAETTRRFCEFLLNARKEYYSDKAAGNNNFMTLFIGYWMGTIKGVVHNDKLVVFDRPKDFLWNEFDITSIQKCVSCRKFFLISRKKRQDRYCCSPECTREYKKQLDAEKYQKFAPVYSLDRLDRENNKKLNVEYKTPTDQFTLKAFKKTFFNDEYNVNLYTAWTETYRVANGGITRKECSFLKKIKCNNQPVILTPSVFTAFLPHRVMSDIIIPRAVFQMLTNQTIISENNELMKLWMKTWKSADDKKFDCDKGFLEKLRNQKNYVAMMQKYRKKESTDEKLEFILKLGVINAALAHNAIIVTSSKKELEEAKGDLALDLIEAANFFEKKQFASNL